MPQDYAEAAKWYRKAAEQGYAEAQYFLAFMYSLGRGRIPTRSASPTRTAPCMRG